MKVFNDHYNDTPPERQKTPSIIPWIAGAVLFWCAIGSGMAVAAHWAGLW